jgi:hypothetical protein
MLCSLEVPDLTSVLTANHAEEELVHWLIAGGEMDFVWDFAADHGIRTPILYDPEEELVARYAREGGVLATRYPVHVLLDAEGVVRYQAFRYDPVSLLAAIDEVLATP